MKDRKTIVRFCKDPPTVITFHQSKLRFEEELHWPQQKSEKIATQIAMRFSQQLIEEAQESETMSCAVQTTLTGKNIDTMIKSLKRKSDTIAALKEKDPKRKQGYQSTAAAAPKSPATKSSAAAKRSATQIPAAQPSAKNRSDMKVAASTTPGTKASTHKKSASFRRKTKLPTKQSKKQAEAKKVPGDFSVVSKCDNGTITCNSCCNSAEFRWKKGSVSRIFLCASCAVNCLGADVYNAATDAFNKRSGMQRSTRKTQADISAGTSGDTTETESEQEDEFPKPKPPVQKKARQTKAKADLGRPRSKKKAPKAAARLLFQPKRKLKRELWDLVDLVVTTEPEPGQEISSQHCSLFYCRLCKTDFPYTPQSSSQIVRHLQKKHNKFTT
jgi:hypothetical protein